MVNNTNSGLFITFLSGEDKKIATSFKIFIDGEPAAFRDKNLRQNPKKKFKLSLFSEFLEHKKRVYFKIGLPSVNLANFKPHLEKQIGEILMLGKDSLYTPKDSLYATLANNKAFKRFVEKGEVVVRGTKVSVLTTSLHDFIRTPALNSS